jgi:MinD-like ATPase involved in chromosome partitioning or flagellar assembly
VRAKDVFARLTSVTTQFLRAQVTYAGFVPRDGRVHTSVMAQRPVSTLYPQSAATLALAAVGEVLDASAPPVLGGGLKLMWQRALRDSIPPEQVA